jgi:hypothetical protein
MKATDVHRLLTFDKNSPLGLGCVSSLRGGRETDGGDTEQEDTAQHDKLR